MRIAVAGGTGLVGRMIVDDARARRDEVVVLARSAGVDLVSGHGLAEALVGVEAVIDTSNVTTTRRSVSVAFFETATTHLVDAAARAGVRHLVVLSIVGIDRCDFGYYLGKRRQEQIALGGSVPTTVLRAAQFHEFAGQLLDRSPLPVVPQMLSQPVAASEVASHLVDLAHGEALGSAPELAGPEERQMVDLARQTQRARGRRLPVLGVPLPGALPRMSRIRSALEWVTGPTAGAHPVQELLH